MNAQKYPNSRLEEALFPLGKNLAQIPQPGLVGTEFFLPHWFLPSQLWLSWPPAMVFSPEEFHSAQTVLLLSILVSLSWA